MLKRPSARRIAALFSVLSIAACTPDRTIGSAGSAGDAGSGGATSTAGTSSSTFSAGGSTSVGGNGGGGGDPGTGGGVACAGVGYESAPLSLVVDSVNATVVDLDGEPVPNLLALLCGLDICIFGATGPSGLVVLGTGNLEVNHPAFKYGDGLTYARFAAPVTLSSITFPAAVTARLPEDGPALVAGQQVTSGDLTLAISAGTEISIDVLTYESPESQQFRAVSIPMSSAPDAVDPALKLEMLVAAGPVDTLFCPPVAASLPNSESWPAGTEVEFFFHGASVGQEYAPYGGWAKLASGHVSADGASVATDPGGGLPVLGVIGIRRVQPGQ